METEGDIETDRALTIPDELSVCRDESLAAEVLSLRARLEEAQDLILAIRSGEVDAFVISDAEQDRVYTLQTADRSYRLFVEQMHQGAALLDSVGTVLFCNRSLASMLGHDLQGLVGARIDRMVDPDSQSVLEGLLARGNEPARQAEVVFRRADNSCVTAHVTSSRLPDDAALVSLIVSDLTEQRYYERLAQAERSLRFALDAAVAVAFTWDIAANRFARLHNTCTTAAAATGNGAETFESVVAAIESSDRDAFVTAINAALNGQTDYRAEFRVIAADGSKRWLAESGRMEFDEAGSPIRLSGLSIDITARKMAEESLRRAHDELESRVAERTAALQTANRALRESEERYRTVVEDQTELLCRRRPDGTVTFVNDVFCRFFGRGREALTGHPWRLADHAENANSGEAELARLRPDEPVAVVASRVFDLHGRVRWMEFVDRGLFAPDGSLVEIQSVGRDITERKEAEERLVRAMETANAATRAKGDFLANLSHEIRTPMNGVIGMTELLMDTALNELQTEYVETIRSSGEALLTVINDILDISKIEAGKMTFDAIPFDLRTVMGQVVDLLTPKARQKGFRLSCHIDPRVPAHVIGDPARIRQVLTNLAGNAVRFTEHGHVTLGVHPVPRRDGHSWLRIEVADSGIGIHPEHHDRVFDSFTQVEAGSTRKYGGTGLGLTICRRLVDLMGGTIGLQSALGKGSTFWFELELARQQPSSGDRAETLQADRPADALAASNAALRADQASRIAHPMARRPISDGALLPVQLRVLIAEDNKVNRRVVVIMAERLGCQVEAVENGKQAVDAFARGKYDLVLMDVQMPEMDGYAATGEIRRREMSGERHIPIIALTAHAMAGARERCLDSGMSDYLTKPITLGPLRETLLRWGTAKARGESAEASERVNQHLADEPGFDVDVLINSCGGDLAVVGEILEMAVADVPDRIERIRSSIAAGDGSRLADDAHALKGTFVVIGAKALAACCFQLCQLGHDKAWLDVEPRFRSVVEQWSGLREDIERFLETAPADSAGRT